ncbi:MAG TPA: CheR family methyltransferase [Burkholderiales bacterium]|nr:CheR family methyltransferase [Burkholderiales bacterium]
MSRAGAAAVLKTGPGVHFAMTAEDFERIRKLVFALCGISLSAAKVDMAYNRLVRLLRTRGMTAFRQYLDLVEGGEPALRQEFVNAMTTNLTRFFREAAHFELLAKLLAEAPVGRPLSIWCAGCSTGEEAYTLAMTAAEVLGERAASVRLLATDVDTDVLGTAAAGIYPAQAARDLDPARLRRFFLSGTGANAGRIRVRPALAERVRFEPHNLRGPVWPAPASFDAIFCRNVLIYFDQKSQAEVLERFRACLRPQGLLFAGHSEYYAHSAGRWNRIAHAVYQPVRDLP